MGRSESDNTRQTSEPRAARTAAVATSGPHRHGKQGPGTTSTDGFPAGSTSGSPFRLGALPRAFDGQEGIANYTIELIGSALDHAAVSGEFPPDR